MIVFILSKFANIKDLILKKSICKETLNQILSKFGPQERKRAKLKHRQNKCRQDTYLRYLLLRDDADRACAFLRFDDYYC